MEQVAAAIELMDAGNTVPFIARYRKEATGGLDEDQLRRIYAAVGKLRSLDERRATVLTSIEEQGKLTPELQQQILAVDTLTGLEDLYAPYKPKRHTRASIARDAGLQGLADIILQQPTSRTSLVEIAKPYLSDQVPTLEDAWSGARDIVAEIISDHAEVRRVIREKAMQWGTLHCEKIDDSEDVRNVYHTYYQFEYGVNRLRSHQVLAINRGEAEKILRVKIEIPERDWRNAITAVFCPDRRSSLAEQFDLAILDLMMENKDSGFILCYKMKKKNPAVPVIIASAVTAETGLNFGVETASDRSWIKADTFIEKGIRPDQLEREINKLLKI